MEIVVINETNFPDERFRNWVTDSVKGADDGVLTPEKCPTVTKIDVSRCHDIQDLTGIKYFTNLKN